MVTLALAPVAAAQTPADQGYGGEGGVAGEVGGSVSGGGGSLPFTGLDLGLLIGGGLLLIAFGVMLRRFSRSRA
jgi:hypothetical protein